MVVDEDFKPSTPTRGGKNNTAYSIFVQACKDEHKRRFPDEQLLMSEFNKKCADRWKIMSDREKKWFNIQAESGDRKCDFTPRTPNTEGGAKRGRKPRSKKDPNAPKRALSGFFWFSNDERGKVKAANPDFGVGDIAKELGRRWAEASEEVKAKFEALAANDRVRYDKEKLAYQSRMKTGISDSLVLDDDDDDD